LKMIWLGWEWEYCSPDLKFLKNWRKKNCMSYEIESIYVGSIWINEHLLKLGSTVCSSCGLNDCLISNLLTAMKPSGLCSCVEVGEILANTNVFSLPKLFLIYTLYCTYTETDLKLVLSVLHPFLSLFFSIFKLT
jgi:hypothetical protein